MSAFVSIIQGKSYRNFANIKKEKKNKFLSGNYRPIALASVVGELMETIVRDSIVNRLEDDW